MLVGRNNSSWKNALLEVLESQILLPHSLCKRHGNTELPSPFKNMVSRWATSIKPRCGIPAALPLSLRDCCSHFLLWTYSTHGALPHAALQQPGARELRFKQAGYERCASDIRHSSFDRPLGVMLTGTLLVTVVAAAAPHRREVQLLLVLRPQSRYSSKVLPAGRCAGEESL